MSSPSSAASDRRRFLRALRHANYRRYFFGQAVSLVGTWMQQTALAWVVLRLTGSDWLMGLNTFVSQIPSLLLLPIVGVLVDRWDRLLLVRVTQTLAMVQAFVLAALLLSGWMEVWHLMALALGLGCVTAFDLPARQALLPELLESKADLQNAIALNSSVFNGARLVGPALAASVAQVSADGEGWCFLLNGVSYLAVLIALAFVRVTNVRPAGPPPPLLEGLTDGLNYVAGQPSMRAIFILVAMIGFLGMPYTIMVPIFAKRVFEGELDSYARMLTASGVGALAGAVYLAGRPNLRGSTSRIVLACWVTAASLATFALSRSFAASLVLMLIAGTTMMLGIVSCNTIIQTIVPDDKRGRTMSLFTLCFTGLTPFGALFVGWLSDACGPAVAMLFCAAGCMLGALVFTTGMGAVRAAIRAHLAAEHQVVVVEEVPDV